MYKKECKSIDIVHVKMIIQKYLYAMFLLNQGVTMFSKYLKVAPAASQGPFACCGARKNCAMVRGADSLFAINYVSP